MRQLRTLIIDNYDSFTYNLMQLVWQVSGVRPLVVLNDQVTWNDLTQVDFSQIILSPGPGRPERHQDFGICRNAIEDGRWPILGICLGHQGIAYVFGGCIAHAPVPMHGRLSQIFHDGHDLFEGMPSPFAAVRYHSLHVARVPDALAITAWTSNGLVMGLKHRHAPIWGVQFHPESIGTKYGDRLLRNFLRLSIGGNAAANQRQPLAPRQTRAEESVRSPALKVFSRALAVDCSSDAVFTNLYSASPVAVWLDSSLVVSGQSTISLMADAGGPHSEVVRYSLHDMTINVKKHSGELLIHGESIFDYLDRRLTELRVDASGEFPFVFSCGYIGYFGYELKAETGGRAAYQSRYPDAQFLFADRFICFDHKAGTVWLVCYEEEEMSARVETWMDNVASRIASIQSLGIMPRTCDDTEQIESSPRHSDQDYIENIRVALAEISNGESYEVCLTNELRSRPIEDTLGAYLILRNMNPAPFSAFMRWPQIDVLCSSPERFIRITPQGEVESKPIKGTLRRGTSPQEDQALRDELRNSEKDLSENLMIVDLVRNDLGKVCVPGSIHVKKMFDVESYTTVHQLVSTIVGHLLPNCSIIDCVRALFPGGSMTGAPKIRTLDILDRLENGPRGIYSGALGFLSLNGAMDLNIVIRTIVSDRSASYIGVGGAIVALSKPQTELDETKLKAAVLLRAFKATV